MMPNPSPKWPKFLPPLTDDQRRISDLFMKLWHEELPQKYHAVENFNHSFPVRYSPADFTTTLEIGAGLGEHLEYEHLSVPQLESYYCNELRANMLDRIRERYPAVKTVPGDCQQRMDFPNGFFDRVLVIHVLEHLPNLPAALMEIVRVLNPTTGKLLVVIPCEGGTAYSLARKISAERLYKKNFGGDYSWFYQREHINRPAEIIAELSTYFTLEKQRFFPFCFLPYVFCNLCIGLCLSPRNSLMKSPGG
jgi:SAM-dependent methyltransferase